MPQAIAGSFGLARDRKDYQRKRRGAAPAAKPQERIEVAAASAGVAQTGMRRRLLNRHGHLDWRIIENISRIRQIPPLPDGAGSL
jgi:hypothetical protein